MMPEEIIDGTDEKVETKKGSGLTTATLLVVAAAAGMLGDHYIVSPITDTPAEHISVVTKMVVDSETGDTSFIQDTTKLQMKDLREQFIPEHQQAYDSLAIHGKDTTVVHKTMIIPDFVDRQQLRREIVGITSEKPLFVIMQWGNEQDTVWRWVPDDNLIPEGQTAKALIKVIPSLANIEEVKEAAVDELTHQ